jgi:hypothetical protein
MPTDEKVAFYLKHRLLIEEWAALREQAARELEEALVRAVGFAREDPTLPTIIEDDSRQFPVYGIGLELQGVEPGSVLVALGWTRTHLLKPERESWPYMGIKVPNAGRGEPLYDTVRNLLQDTARERGWIQSTGGWAWWDYLRLAASETDLDDYATRRTEDLVAAWKAMQSVINQSSGRSTQIPPGT